MYIQGGPCREVLIMLIKCILSILSVIMPLLVEHVTKCRNRTSLKEYHRQKNMNVISASDVLILHTDWQMGGECPELTSGNEY